MKAKTAPSAAFQRNQVWMTATATGSTYSARYNAGVAFRAGDEAEALAGPGIMGSVFHAGERRYFAIGLHPAISLPGPDRGKWRKR